MLIKLLGVYNVSLKSVDKANIFKSVTQHIMIFSLKKNTLDTLLKL